MKKLIFLILVSVSIAGAGCNKDFESLNTNANKPTAVPASLLLNNLLFQMYDAPYGTGERYAQYYLCNYDYYGNNRYDFGPGDDHFDELKNATKMVEEAEKGGLPAKNVYSAMSKFFKAYFFTKMSLEMGDVPMTEALKGSENLKPSYDDQKTVFMNSFAYLDSANTELGELIAAGDNNLQGDIYFNNDLTKWRKVVNALHLRLLIHLSLKAGDAELNIPGQFNQIVSNPDQYPIMEDMTDNMQFQYVHPTNDYPMNPDNFGFDALRYNTSATYIGLLTQLQDPRVFVTAEPAGALVSGGTSPTSFAAFVGADPGEDLGNMYIKANGGQYSLINRFHYYQTYTAEPSIQIGYPEMLLNIAEAINRGWITGGPKGSAEEYYQAAIKASMNYYGIPETGGFIANFLVSGSPGSTAIYSTHNIGFTFTDYYNQASVKYAGNNATGLTQILQQKYLALFRHSGYESYFNYRRTGVPNFTTGPGTGNSERIPVRFQYPSTEKSANDQNYNAALETQYGGNDDINAKMWLLK